MNRFDAKSIKAARESKSSVNHTKGALVIVDFSRIENRDLKLLLSNFSYSGVNNMSSPHIVCLQIETAFMQSSFSFSCINCKRLFYGARQLYFSLQLILLFNQQKIKRAGNEKKICPKNILHTFCSQLKTQNARNNRKSLHPLELEELRVWLDT